MEKIKRIYINNRFFIVSLGITLFFTLVYLSKATSNIPIMDYWRYINNLVDRIFINGITFSDLWANQGVYRYPLIYLLFSINVKYFHYNTQLEIYLGCIVMAITACIIYKMLKTYFCNSNKFILFSGCILLLMAIFNLNQWEILTLEFSLGFSLRILSLVLAFKYTDFFLRNMETQKNNMINLALAYIIIICLFSAAYFPALVGAIIFSIAFRFFMFWKVEKFKYLNSYLILGLGLLLGTCIYMNGIDLGNVTISENGLLSTIFNFDILKALIIMLGSSLVGVYGINISFIVGCLFLCVYIFSIIWYLYSGMYKKTYMPMLLIAYAIMAIFLIYLGRSSLFNLEYLASSRYVCETTMGIIGVVWILLDCFSSNISKLKKSRKIICCSFLIFIIASIGYADFKEYNTAIYRKAYADNLIVNMMRVDELDSSEIALYQANNDELVINGVKILKHYNLGVFQYADTLNY